jgi:hypothetical protein
MPDPESALHDELVAESSDKTEKIICYGKGISHDNRINYSSSRIP